MGYAYIIRVLETPNGHEYSTFSIEGFTAVYGPRPLPVYGHLRALYANQLNNCLKVFSFILTKSIEPDQ